MQEFKSIDSTVVLLALVSLGILCVGIFINLRKINKRNALYVPQWQLILSFACALESVLIALLYACFEFDHFHPSNSLVFHNLTILSLTLSGMNGIFYGLRLKKLMGIPQQTRNTLIEEQLLMQNVSQSQQNLALKEKVIETKRRHLKSQMNPHFLFNVLTGIQHLLQNADSERAGRVFSRFRRLLMLGFMSQDQILGPLHQEISHVEQYVDLERVRLTRPFEFAWDISPDVDTHLTPCPLFILQPLVENAIWHGLSSDSGQHSKLRIRIEWQEEDLVIAVHDNGSGLRKKDGGAQKHDSRGTSIVTERLALLRHRGSLTVTECPAGHPFETGVASVLRFPLWALEPAWHDSEQLKAS